MGQPARCYEWGDGNHECNAVKSPAVSGATRVDCWRLFLRKTRWPAAHKSLSLLPFHSIHISLLCALAWFGLPIPCRTGQKTGVLLSSSWSFIKPLPITGFVVFFAGCLAAVELDELPRFGMVGIGHTNVQAVPAVLPQLEPIASQAPSQGKESLLGIEGIAIGGQSDGVRISLEASLGTKARSGFDEDLVDLAVFFAQFLKGEPLPGVTIGAQTHVDAIRAAILKVTSVPTPTRARVSVKVTVHAPFA